MDPALRNRIISQLKQEFASLTPRMQVVAKYVLDNPADFGLDPIRETARKSGVSTFTLVRMAERLGFQSFEEFREPFRHALVSATEAAIAPDWLAERGKRGDAGRVYSESAHNTLAIVQRSLERVTPEQLDRAADLMLSAPRVYVTAVRASYAMAYYFHYVGRMALTSLHLIPRNMGSAIDELNFAEPGDVMFAMTISPYSRETIEACQFAQAKGVKLILLTDSDMVSTDLEPEVVLVASVVSSHYFGCFSGMTAVLEALLSLLVSRGGADADRRIKSYEKLRLAYNAYWQGRKKH